MHPDDKKGFYNRWWRITHFYKIKTKEAGESKRLELNPVQALLAKYVDFWNFHLVLKADNKAYRRSSLRGISTQRCSRRTATRSSWPIPARTLGSCFRSSSSCMNRAHRSSNLRTGTIWHKPVAKYDTRNELYFEGINSTIYVALKIRSTTVHRLHVSKWAFIKNAQKVLTATFAAVPKTGVITGESTANGMGGSFFEEWQNEDSRFMKHFFGYQDHPDYCDRSTMRNLPRKT